MPLRAGASATLRAPLTNPATGKRHTLPPRLIGAATAALAAAAPLKTRSDASTPNTASENVTSMLTLLVVMVVPVVGAWAFTIGGMGSVDGKIVRLQPPTILPESPPKSSTTNSLQAPLGPVPLKIDNVVPVGAP